MPWVLLSMRSTTMPSRPRTPTSAIVAAMLADALVSYPAFGTPPARPARLTARNGGLLDVLTPRNKPVRSGVFAASTYLESCSLESGYSSTVKFQDLTDLEDWLKTLWSPLARRLSQDRSGRPSAGAQLYQINCVSLRPDRPVESEPQGRCRE